LQRGADRWARAQVMAQWALQVIVFTVLDILLNIFFIESSSSKF